MTAPEPPYATPQAARSAVTDRLRRYAADSPWPLPDLQRQYAYDQLVERLYRVDDGWVIKGATALLARRVSVRHTLDIDVYRAGAIADVERLVRDAAGLDIGDWMHFDIGTSVTVEAAGAQASRAKVRSFVGTKLWAAFQIDIVADGILVTGEPDLALPLTAVDDRAVEERQPWRVYPLVDHIADKICAILEHHHGRASTRVKDLIDLVAITQRGTVTADAEIRALTTEAARRHLTLPETFDIPDRQIWAPTYRSQARHTTGLHVADLDHAHRIVRAFVDPLLAGTATGAWNPATQCWDTSTPT